MSPGCGVVRTAQALCGVTQRRYGGPVDPDAPFVHHLLARPARSHRWAWRWRRAAVAVVLRPGADGLELLLVRRAAHAGDPWSGNMAMPGGKAQPEDLDIAATAAREAREEVGLALGAPLGTLSDQLAADPRTGRPMALTPVVYTVGAEARAEPDGVELVEALWIPLRELADPAHRFHRWRWLGPVPTRWPERRLRGRVVWGLTLRVVDEIVAAWDDGAAGPVRPGRAR